MEISGAVEAVGGRRGYSSDGSHRKPIFSRYSASRIAFALDAVLIVAACVFAAQTIDGGILNGSQLDASILYSASIFFFSIILFKYYSIKNIIDKWASVRILCRAYVLILGMNLAAALFIDRVSLSGFFWLSALLAGLGIGLWGTRTVFRRILLKLRDRGSLDLSSAVIVVGGINERVERQLEALKRRGDRDEIGRRVLGAVFCDYGIDTSSQNKHFQDVALLPTAALFDWISENNPQSVVIFSPSGLDLEKSKTFEPLVRALSAYPLQIEVVGGEVAPCWSGMDVSLLDRYLTGKLDMRPLSESALVCKRLIDLVGAIMLMPLVLPTIGVIALLIKLDSPGPVFFRQARSGLMHKEFQILKFRTMRDDREAGHDFHQATRCDPRVTRVGSWLRSTSLDELPQFFNVLGGSMSLVGPRPHAIQHDNLFRTIVNDYGGRLRVKPGITGWAQIHGLRGPTPTKEIMEERIALDRFYIENWSLALDLRILVATVSVPFRADAF